MNTLSATFRYCVVVVLLCAVVFILREYYFAIYRAPRCDAISRDLRMFYEDETNDDDDDVETNPDLVERRDKIFKLRQRLGVGIDSLPSVRFDSVVENEEAYKHDSDDTEIEERLLRERRNECLTFGSFVSSLDEFVDCRSYCSVSDGVAYRYYDRLGQFLNGRKGRIGAYCVPTDAAICNTNTSLTIYGKDGWLCIPQIRAFAGEGGNMIVACNGNLLDRVTGKIWHRHIDSTLAFDSIDEYLPGTNEYRFVCPPDLDERNNKRVESPFDRLTLLNNTCASLIPNANEDIFPDFKSNRCECGQYARFDVRLNTCIPKDSKIFDTTNDPFLPQTMEMTLKYPYSSECIETWMTISQALSLMDAAIPKKLSLCGVEHQNAGIGAANPAYNRARVSIFDRLVPSPVAMSISAPSVDR